MAGSGGDQAEEHGAKASFEARTGLLLVIVAALVAVSELASSKFSSDAIVAVNTRASTYVWYHSKSVKELVVSGQRELLLTLMKSHVNRPEESSWLQAQLNALAEQASLLEKKKQELLVGSTAVGAEYWAQEDAAGKLGQIVGAKQWDGRIARLDRSGNYFDVAGLLLQLSLVLGASSLTVEVERSRRLFHRGMMALAALGTVMTGVAIAVGVGV